MGINPVSVLSGGGIDAFARPADVTAYVAGDRIAEATSDSDTTPLRKLFDALQKGGSGVIMQLDLHTSLATFLDVINVHLFNLAAPPTAIPGDNAAMGVLYANRASYLGFFALPALVEPIATAVSDVAYGTASLGDGFRFVCAKGDSGIYYALQTTGTGTPASGQTFSLRTRTIE